MASIARPLPGGGAMKQKPAYAAGSSYDEKNCSVSQKWEMVEKPKDQPVHELYTSKMDGETGTVNQSKVAMLKAKPNRPKQLKRKPTSKLSKEEKKVLIQARKEAKAKYAERSEIVKKERLCMKKSLIRQRKFAKVMRKKCPNSKAPKPYKNIQEIMYSVGPQPKYATMSKNFREYRKFAKAQMKYSKSHESRPIPTTATVTYIFKIGKKSMEE